MKKKLTLTLTFFAAACVLTGCSQDNHDNELPDIFISEFYSGEDADDCVVELGTSSKEEWSLEGIKVNFYGSKNLSYTLDLSNKTISYENPILIINKDSPFDATSAESIKLDDNYLYGSYYLEIVNSEDEIIDCVGYKGFNISYVRNQSMVRLSEKFKPTGTFDELNYIKVKAGEAKYLNNLESPISENELLTGPRLSEDVYGDYLFQENNSAKGGYLSVTVKSLGDGDTTFFNFPADSGVSSDESMRYLLIDTPEIDHGPNGNVDAEPWGNKAKKVNNEKLTSAKGIIVQSNRDFPLHENYGRLLGYVWYTNSDDTNDLSSYRLLNFEMVKDGLAKFSDREIFETMFYGDIYYFDYLRYAYNYAKKLGVYIHGQTDPDFKS